MGATARERRDGYALLPTAFVENMRVTRLPMMKRTELFILRRIRVEVVAVVVVVVDDVVVRG